MEAIYRADRTKRERSETEVPGGTKPEAKPDKSSGFRGMLTSSMKQGSRRGAAWAEVWVQVQHAARSFSVPQLG